MKTKRIIIQFCTVLLGVLVFQMSFSACKKLPIQASIQNRLDKATEDHFDGVILCVRQNGESKLYSSGWNNKELNLPADPNSLFKIASISKLYIAVACSKLINDKKLSKYQSLAYYLPNLKDRIENADEITLRMLIQHRSGIPDYIDASDFSWLELCDDNEECLNLILDKKAEFKPDARRKYSNTNYLLIGLILDEILGYSHHEYIENEILTPLNLTNTFSLMSEVDDQEVMSGYFKDGSDDLKSLDYIHPGGSMISTAEEVSIFLSALNEGELLNEQEQEIYNDLYEMEHTGLLPGYQSIAKYNCSIDASVVLFMNTSGGNCWGKGTQLFRRIVRDLK